MRYPRIAEKIYAQPWCITPSQHAAIQRAFEGSAETTSFKETEVESDDSPLNIGPVAVIPIFGIIGKHLSLMETACGGVDLGGISGALDVALNDPETKSILLHFNSPGGTVTGVPELASRIASASKVKPIVAYTDGQMCSAAYWLASQCTAVYASQSADVGSIGVYLALLDESVAMAQQGVKVNLIKAGKLKAAGAPFQALTDDERAMFQVDVNKIYDRFTSAVVAGRGKIAEEEMQGQSFDGEDAALNGLTDGVLDSIDDALDLLAALPR